MSESVILSVLAWSLVKKIKKEIIHSRRKIKTFFSNDNLLERSFHKYAVWQAQDLRSLKYAHISLRPPITWKARLWERNSLNDAENGFCIGKVFFPSRRLYGNFGGYSCLEKRQVYPVAIPLVFPWKHLSWRDPTNRMREPILTFENIFNKKFDHRWIVWTTLVIHKPSLYVNKHNQLLAIYRNGQPSN